jgi:hypothetical protein
MRVGVSRTTSAWQACLRRCGSSPATGTRSSSKRLTAALAVAAAIISLPGHARAAGGAYAVDTAEISEAGSCKVESWVSWASNRDFIGNVNPSCAMEFIRPFELSTQITRARADDEWGTAASPKVKVNLVPTAIGKPGLAVSATATFDLMTHENAALAVVAPATLRLSEVVRINLNGGWLWDRTVDRHYLTYGAGVDWRTPDNVYTLTAEVFGQAGVADVASVTQPRFQLGFRYRPIDRFSVDIIYGRNIAGENANWLTLATIVRFPPSGK